MYSGHLAPITVLTKYYPNVSPFVFSFGVGILDIAFGILSYFEYEGLTLNPEAGYMGADGFIDYSHSLLGTIVLATLFGMITGQFIPGFLAVFSHFIGDWLVHNQDLVLDPFTKIKIGGTNLWGQHPTFAFYLELAVILFASGLSSKDMANYSVTGILLGLHWMNRPSAKLVATELALIPKDEIGMKLMTSMFIYFGLPALLIGSILTYGRNIKKTKLS